MEKKSVSLKKKDKDPTGGLSSSGRAKYNKATGSNLKPPVTESKPSGERKKRKDYFCARMSGVKGALKDEKGNPTRKALALKKWKCSS